MTLIDKNIKNINLVVDQYDQLRNNELANLIKTITSSLESILDELAPYFNLVDKNSVREIKYYRFVDRLKETKSLKEKFVRSNILHRFKSIDFELLEQKDGESILDTKSILFELDDLLGIKVLTDLLCDAKGVMEIFKSSEFKTRAKGKNIRLNEDDISKQPVIMKNGLPIYKIKGIYDGKYNFELQIKSKLISAWGDMEHSIFYKDYAISPVRDTAKKSMVHVGKLLFNIDEFLESIRNADKDYGQNAKALLFMEWMIRSYGDRISMKLDGVGFNISVISEILYAVKVKNQFDDDIAEKALRFNHFEINTKNGEIQKYIDKRNQSFELQILESIILSWRLNEQTIIVEQDIDNILNDLLTTLVEAQSYVLEKDLPGKELSEIQELLQLLHNKSFTYGCDFRFLTDIKKTRLFIDTVMGIDDFSEVVDQETDSELIDSFKVALFLQNNDGDVEQFIKDDIEGSQFIFQFQKLEEAIPEKNTKYSILKKEINSLINKLN